MKQTVIYSCGHEETVNLKGSLVAQLNYIDGDEIRYALTAITRER